MNGRKGARDHLIHHSNDGMFSIRQGEWKLIMGRGSVKPPEPRRIAAKSGEPEGQLFHIARDPAETNDVYAEHPEVVARLTALLRKYQSADRTR
jgi:arylsulfatase A